jgi:hypothetical protein
MKHTYLVTTHILLESEGNLSSSDEYRLAHNAQKIMQKACDEREITKDMDLWLQREYRKQHCVASAPTSSVTLIKEGRNDEAR